MRLRAQVEISLLVSSRVLLCYRFGLDRIVFGLDLEKLIISITLYLVIIRKALQPNTLHVTIIL